MNRFRPRSMLALVATGYLVVALPLMIAIPFAYQSVGDLTTRSQNLVVDTAALVDLGSSLGDQLNALDRAARQYAVLRDSEGLAVVDTRRQTVLTTLDALTRFPEAVPSTPISRIRAQVEPLTERLSGKETTIQGSLAALSALDAERRNLLSAIGEYVQSQVRAVSKQADDTQRQLAIPTVALIPASIALAVIFTYLIVRPIRQFSIAIRRMGRGRLHRPVTIDGPVELVELAKDLDWMRQQLLAMEQEKDRFLQHMSHELKTPLASFIEGVALMRDGVVGEPSSAQNEVLEILSVSADQLKRLIENLLQYHEWANVTHTPSMESLDIHELVEGVLLAHRLSARAANIELNNATEHLQVTGHAGSLQLAVSNLISNALKYSPNGGRVDVGTLEVGHHWTLIVDDAGQGVPVNERERIFEPFVQGDTPGQGPLEGSGIGLAVVASCMRRHGGTARVDCSPLGGARFILEAPIRP